MLSISRETLMPLFRRTAKLVQEGLTTQAPDVMKIPVSEYVDDERWNKEVSSIYRRRPLPLAFTCELREPGSYRALVVLGVPVLITRTKTGEVRAFMNSCRHRGLPVAANGSGRATRFTCRYHGWTYGVDGRLLGVADESSFGKIDHSCYGLTPLAVAERAGMIFVVLTPGEPLDLDSWLGDFGPVLDEVGLQSFELYSVTELKSPNWKIVWEGYSETYHFATLHPNSFATNQLPNVLLVDKFGPHRRICVPRRGIDLQALQPEDAIQPVDYLTTSFQLFPTMQFAFAFIGDRDSLTPGVQAMVSQVFPADEPGESLTIHRILTSRKVTGTPAEEATRAFAAETLRTVRDEDYPALWEIQRSMSANRRGHFLIGRNEIALQHFHQTIHAMLAEN